MNLPIVKSEGEGRQKGRERKKPKKINEWKNKDDIEIIHTKVFSCRLTNVRETRLENRVNAP